MLGVDARAAIFHNAADRFGIDLLCSNGNIPARRVRLVMACTALTTRFTMTCCNCVRSTITFGRSDAKSSEFDTFLDWNS